MNFRELKVTLFRNEDGNYYKDESECLNAMLASVIDGKTQLYCKACDLACQFCPRKGHWIKFNVSLNTNCYCDMTTCVDGVSTIGGIDTVRCSGNAIMDGRGKCIDLVERKSTPILMKISKICSSPATKNYLRMERLIRMEYTLYSVPMDKLRMNRPK